MERSIIAVDLAKNVFEIAVSAHPGKVAERHRVSRAKMLPFFAERQAALVVMEACGSAHYWGARIQELGHEVRLLPPHLVRPYAGRNKTDRADAKGMLEAVRNEDIRPVPVKSDLQQALTALHRLRAAWVGDRIARLNALRGLLREVGFTIPEGARHVLPAVQAVVEDAESRLLDPVRLMFAEACEEIRGLEARIATAEQQLRKLAPDIPVVATLLSVPGIGLLTATALVGFVGDIHRFASSRHFASYLGLTPREHSSGQKRHLGRISKRGGGMVKTCVWGPEIRRQFS